MKPILIHDDAEEELRNSCEYYARQRKGLDDEFLNEIEAALKRIRRNPLAFSRCSDSDFRRCNVSRFPFTVFFKEDETCIRVAAIADQKRKPGYWLNRTFDD